MIALVKEQISKRNVTRKVIDYFSSHLVYYSNLFQGIGMGIWEMRVEIISS